MYSRGEYLSLPEDFLEDKAIIRIHNINDKEWYEHEVDKGIVMFFNDLKSYDLSRFDKIKAQYFNRNYKYFTKRDCLQLINFIHENKNKDIVVHCQFGRSRSVAVAVHLKNKYQYAIANKTDKELEKANDWMLTLFNKYDL